VTSISHPFGSSKQIGVKKGKKGKKGTFYFSRGIESSFVIWYSHSGLTGRFRPIA